MTYHLKFIGSTDWLKLHGFKHRNGYYFHYQWFISVDDEDRSVTIGAVLNESIIFLYDMIQQGLVVKVNEKGERV